MVKRMTENLKKFHDSEKRTSALMNSISKRYTKQSKQNHVYPPT